MQGNMLEEARRPARNRRAVMGEALRKALDMRYVRAGEYVNDSLHGENASEQGTMNATYRTHEMGRAALSQVRFQPGNHLKKTV
ncbi:MAG: hypothetical protein IKT57_05985 [Clostridia bacterium]|nr:hypothetical protein [Clostridia bacterium]